MSIINVQKIGMKIKQKREEKHLKQRELAEMAEVSRSMIACIETGRIVPSVKTLCKIAIALDEEISYFFENVVTNNVHK